MALKTKISSRDLPTKIVRSADGTTVRMKVVQSDSETLPQDLLAAFRSNVRRITAERRKRAHVAENTAEV